MSLAASARPRPSVSLTAMFSLSIGPFTPRVPMWPVVALPRPLAPAQLVDQILRVLRSEEADSAESTTPAAGASQAHTVPSAASPASPPESVEELPTGEQPIVKGPFAVEDMSMDELVREHADAVYRVALSVTRDPTLAEDASQDALIKAWQALPSFRGDAPLRNWILRITHNTAISLLRKRRDELRDPNELPDTISYRTVESQVHDRMALDRFELALKDLDSLSRSIVVLREVEGLSYDEICDVLDLPMPTVKTRLLRARRQLAIALDGWQP